MDLAFAPVTASDLGFPAPHALSAAIPMFVVGLLMGLRRLPRIAACLTLVAGAALTTGWMYEVINRGVGWTTSLINVITRTTVGGVVPGALAIGLLVFYLLELRPDARTLSVVTRLRDPRSLGDLVTTGSGRRTGRRVGRGEFLETRGRGGRGRRPEKLAAATVGLILPSVVATIPGTIGAIAMSIINVIGGAGAWPLAAGFGVS